MEVDNSLGSQVFAAFGDKTLYEILSVERDASSEDIRRAYRRMALKVGCRFTMLYYFGILNIFLFDCFINIICIVFISYLIVLCHF
jgi:hypothetical protein